MILTGLNAFIDNFEKRASEIENSNNRVSVLNMGGDAWKIVQVGE